jgi:hypothetical protein
MMSRETFPRVNFFDGQEIKETDLDVEQTAWHDSLANGIDFLAGSGVEQEYSIQRVLFDTAVLPASVTSLINTGNFDGEPIYETDNLGLTVFHQPSDSSQGNQLDVEVLDSDLIGSFKCKVYIFGRTYGGKFEHEVLTFNRNEVQVTYKYFTKIIAIMTQNFRGNQNALVTGLPSRNAGGRLKILESTAMKLVRDPIMAEQSIEPNMDYVNFIPSVPAKTLGILLQEISDKDSTKVEDLRINTTSTGERELPPDVNGLIVGEKFQATTDNIQKITFLLSVRKDELAVPGHAYPLFVG